jgi:hypothetical protein
METFFSFTRYSSMSTLSSFSMVLFEQLVPTFRLGASFEVHRHRRSGSDQKNGETNLFSRRARLANYLPAFKPKMPLATCRKRLKVWFGQSQLSRARKRSCRSGFVRFTRFLSSIQDPFPPLPRREA